VSAAADPRPAAPDRPRSWWGRPGGPAGSLAVAALVLAAPLWLWADPPDGYHPRDGVVALVGRLGPLAEPFGRTYLFLDDFDYVAKSRTPADLSRHLWTPHNTHVVPLFRLWTFAWVRAAGSLEALPPWLGLAAYLGYLAATLLVGLVVARETGRAVVGLAAMAGFGVSALLNPAVAWYSASQAVAAGAGVLAALAAAQAWRARGGLWRMAAAAALTAAAPLLWSGGYVAGPALAAYLWADGRPRCRRAAAVPPLASALTASLALATAGARIAAAENFHGRPLSRAADPWQGALSTAQGVVEILVLRNLGLAATTTPAQAVALGLLFAGLWAWSRGRRPGQGRLARFAPNPLEAAGGVTAVLGFGLVYTARGYFTFDNLRDLSWYQAIPQVGAVLFAAGWWSGRGGAGLPAGVAAPTRGGLAAVAAGVALALVLQTPRVRARVEGGAAPLLAAERLMFPTPMFVRLRERYLETARVAWQRRFLARLDRAEASARELGLGREAVRRGVGRVFGPGMPPDVPQIDGVNLLALPESAPRIDGPALARARLAPLLQPEPEPRPRWLRPADPWPPPPPGAGR